MFASFKCETCSSKIVVDDSDSQNIPRTCSNCGSIISNPQYISSFFENCLSLQRGLDGLEFCGLSSGQTTKVYDSDVESLTEVYNQASLQVKKLLLQILDKNFLMVYDNAKDENIEKLEEYKDKLDVIWTEKINTKNENLIRRLTARDD